MFPGRAKRPLLGVDITVSAVKLVELAQSGESYRVESYATEPMPPGAMNSDAILDVRAVAKVLRRAVKRSGTRSREAAVAISGDSVITRTIRVPGQLSNDEIQGHVVVQAEQFVPFPMEEASLDFEIMGDSEAAAGMVDVLLVAARSLHVSQRQRTFRAAGIEVRVVEPEQYAMERACRLLTHQMIGGGLRLLIAVVEIGAVTTTFNALLDRRLIYTRDFDFGGRQLIDEIVGTCGLSQPEAEKTIRSGEWPKSFEREILDGFREELAQQVSRALQFYLASGGTVGQPVQILVCGGCASLPGIAEAVAERAGIRTQVAEPVGHLSISSKAQAMGLRRNDPALMTAFGLAIRHFE